MGTRNAAQLWDCIVVGGGPAGLTAGIYLGRFKRSVLIFDTFNGRSHFHQVNENYFGFPEGIAVRDLVEKGRNQAEKYGAKIQNEEVKEIIKNQDNFQIVTNKSNYYSKTIILATGVKDVFPDFEEVDEYVGRSLFWCITCDGYLTKDKELLLVGHDDEVAVTAMQFLNYTKEICLVTNQLPGKDDISPDIAHELSEHGIRLIEAKIDKIEGEDGKVKLVVLDNYEVLKPDLIFSMQGAIPQVNLAARLGVELDEHGYIKTDDEQRTNVPFVYAAGDVTKMFSHQVVTAAHEGSMAAQAANYDLYLPHQKH